AGNRAVRWRGRQGTNGEILPLTATATTGGVDHAAQHGAVLLDPGRHDPHPLIVFLRAQRGKDRAGTHPVRTRPPHRNLLPGRPPPAGPIDPLAYEALPGTAL